MSKHRHHGRSRTGAPDDRPIAAGRAEGAFGRDQLSVAAATAIGLPPFTRLTITGPTDRELVPQMADIVEQAVAKAVARRPDMRSVFAGRRAIQEGVPAARADFMPNICALGTAEHSAGARTLTAPPGFVETPTLAVSGARASATMLVGFRVLMFDGGARSALLEPGRNRANVADAWLEATRNQAILVIVALENDGADAHAAAMRAAATLALATGALGACDGLRVRFHGARMTYVAPSQNTEWRPVAVGCRAPASSEKARSD